MQEGIDLLFRLTEIAPASFREAGAIVMWQGPRVLPFSAHQKKHHAEDAEERR